MNVHPTLSARDRFVEQMGLLSQEDGGPRIAGRIFGLLLIEGRPMTLHEIATRLRISKASASTNARLLASRNILRRRTRPGERQDYYELESNNEFRVLDAIGNKLSRSAALIDEVAEDVSSEDAAAGERVRQLAEFYRQSASFVAAWSRRFKDA